MSNFAIIRVERLKTMGNVKASALHTFREIETGNAISEKFADNEFVGAKDAEGVYQAVSARIDKIEKKDKQATRCLEFFISASPEQFAENGALHDQESQQRFFDESLNFIKNKHGAENVVFHAIHRDEKSPHMVVYAVPVVHREAHTRKRSVGVKGGGRTLKEEFVPAANELSAKAYYHCPAALALLQDEYHAGVGMEFGLDRGISRVAGRSHKKTSVYYAEKDAELEARAGALEVRESDVTMNFAKIDRHWEVLERDKSRLADELEAVAAQKQNLDALAANLANGQQLLTLDREKFAQDEKDLAKRLSALNDREAALKAGLADLTKRQGEMDLRGSQLDQREAGIADDMKHLERVSRGQENTKAGLDQRKADMDALEVERSTKIAAVKDSLQQREDKLTVLAESIQAKQEKYKTEVIEPFYEQRTAFRTVTQGHTPEQIAGALTVIETTKKKGIDMEHLTQGDCVIILGKTWAEKKGIRTAEDMMKPASPEDAAWARRVGLPKPKPEQTQGVKR